MQFKETVDLQKWQQIQDYFAEVLGVTLRTIDKSGSFLTRPSGSSRLCDEILRNTVKGTKECDDQLSRTLESSRGDWKEGVCWDRAGLWHFAVPLKVGSQNLGCMVVGPVILGKRRQIDEYRKVVQELGVDSQDFFDALRETKTFSFNGIKSVIELLYDIGIYICELGYQNTRLKNIIPEAPQIIFRVYDFYLEKLLDALLEVSYNFTEAERGSIMLLDESKNELYIKVAKGLRKDIIDRARSKVNVGIAGIVAHDNKPLFIDEDIEDERIRSQLKNPNLRYSISMPIARSDRVLGVLNLGTSSESSDKFSSQSMTTIDKLTQLVEKALTNIPLSRTA
ncbi:MAG: PocR ligand-binding domain-containing protein [Candidatus Omnitrophica bacterium]|nr:PocR ligand-binding domain-containing protein [Candidatus Omnitrophota bacterium]